MDQPPMQPQGAQQYPPRQPYYQPAYQPAYQPQPQPAYQGPARAVPVAQPSGGYPAPPQNYGAPMAVPVGQ